MNTRKTVVCDLGRVAYGPAWALQKDVQARLVAAKRAKPREVVENVLLLVEHPPVYTLGKSGVASNILLSEAALAARGASLFHIDRGGDVTFHGPGQMVAYPILDLDHFFTDIHRYLRELEEAIIGTCADFGVEGRRVEGRTGVWIGPDEAGLERKICAFGIRCSRWVTMHGLALNVDTDLSYFEHIIPCGIADRGVTSLARERGEATEGAAVRARFLDHFAARFGADLIRKAGAEAFAYLEGVLNVTGLESRLRPAPHLEPEAPAKGA